MHTIDWGVTRSMVVPLEEIRVPTRELLDMPPMAWRMQVENMRAAAPLTDGSSLDFHKILGEQYRDFAREIYNVQRVVNDKKLYITALVTKSDPSTGEGTAYFNCVRICYLGALSADFAQY